MNLKQVAGGAASVAVLLSMALAAPRSSLAAEAPLVIVNQAADGIVNYLVQKLPQRPGQGATRADVLAGLDRIVDQYQGTGVTHLFWNVNYQRAAYRSAVWPSYWDLADPEREATEWPRTYYELHKLGVDDVFARLIPRSRQRGISPWISLRMNDHHYTRDPSRVSPLFFDHPELRCRRGSGLFNYARPEVREHYRKLAAEVLERYDIDGLELDWMRTPDNFDADDMQRGRAILTDFVQAVRQLTIAAGQRRGHPVRLAVRVPATPEFALGKGFDAIAWVRAGLLDMLVPSEWWSGCTDIPIEAWRAQIGADAPQCLLVPSSGSTYSCTLKGAAMVGNLAAMRGFAASMLDRGADGIHLFNHFHAVESAVRLRTPDGKSVKECLLADVLRAAGDLPAAVRHPRVHVVTIHESVPAKSSYQPALPATLAAQQPIVKEIHIGPRPTTGRCTVHVGLDKSDDLAAAALAVRINGVDCTALEDLPRPARPEPRPELPRMHVCEVAPRVTQFAAPVTALTRGYNRIELAALHGGPQTVVWLEVLIEP